MEIKEIADKKLWEDFLAKQRPASFLQSWNWGEFNERSGHKIWRLGFYEHNTLVGVAMITKVIARRGSFLFAPHLCVDLRLLPALTEYLKPVAKKEGCVFIRISPLLSNTPEHAQVFSRLGYKNAPIHMMHPELAWILDLSPSEDQLLTGMRKTTRYSIKKAEKDGVTISTSQDHADFEKFYAVYKQTVVRQDFRPFSESYFRAEIEIFFKENQAAFFFAHYKGEITGAALIVFYGSSAFYHHGGTTRKFGSLTDAQLLQWHVIKEAKARGLKFYNFWGVVPETLTNHPWSGLSTFKRGFGGFSEAYLHAQDLILSPKYLITYAVERVRRIRRHL